MTFVQLQYFVKIVDCKSINAAAEACYVSYNAMYKALKSLEKELQVKLVARNTAGVVLTAAGEKFYADAIKILEIAQSWETMKHQQTENEIVKICTAPVFVNNDTLKILSEKLRAENILLDYQAALSEYMEAMFLQKNNFIFLYPHTPKYIFQNLAQKNGYHSDYLCSDDCQVFINADYLTEGQTDTTLEELSSFTPIKITNDYNKLASFDSMSLLKNAKACYTFQNYEEAISTLLTEKTFLLLRSSLKNHIQTNYSEKIETLRLKDFPTGVDYYVAYRPNCSQAAQIFIEQIKSFCQQHYSTQKYFG